MSECAVNEWLFSMTLSCGHEISFGTVDTADIPDLTPRRADSSFGSMRCPHGCGRRRVRCTTSRSMNWIDGRKVAA